MATFPDAERRARFGERGYRRALDDFDSTKPAEGYAALYRGDCGVCEDRCAPAYY